MKTILSLISMSALVIGLSLVTGCSKEATSPVQPDSHSYGSASFNIANNFQISIASANSASRAANVADGNYNVNIKNKDNSSSVFASTYSELGEGLELEAANYTIAAENCDLQTALSAAEGRGQLRLAGTKDFLVETGKNTNVDLLCTVSNVKASINYATSFTDAFSTFNVQIAEIGNSSRVLSYDQDATLDTQVGFFNLPADAATTSLVVTVNATRKSDGVAIPAFSLTIADVHAAEWHKLTLKVRQGESSFNITYDDAVTDVVSEHFIDPYATV